MAGRMANWIARQQRHLSEADFSAWVAGEAKVQSFLDRQSRIPAAVRALDDFQKDVLAKVVAPGLERASNFLATVEKAGAAAYTKTGLLAQSIGSTKAKLYPATFCAYVASGPRRGFARTRTLKQTKNGPVAKHTSKKFTLAHPDLAVANPVEYGYFLTRGRKALRPVNGKALATAAGRFFARAKAAPPKNFMASAEAARDSAANIATCAMQLNLQKLAKE